MTPTEYALLWLLCLLYLAVEIRWAPTLEDDDQVPAEILADRPTPKRRIER